MSRAPNDLERKAALTILRDANGCQVLEMLAGRLDLVNDWFAAEILDGPSGVEPSAPNVTGEVHQARYGLVVNAPVGVTRIYGQLS
jgi:hypothetical protein